jgi:hypothetical protein
MNISIPISQELEDDWIVFEKFIESYINNEIAKTIEEYLTAEVKRNDLGKEKPRGFLSMEDIQEIK